MRSPMPFREADEEQVARVEAALRKAKINSPPGPDQIPYRLMKLIQDTELGRAFHDIPRVAEGAVPAQQETHDLIMTMISKPNKGRSKIKGW